MNTPGLIRALALSVAFATAPALFSQGFSSGSNNSDGALDVPAGDTLVPKKPGGSSVYQYSTIRIRPNARVKFERNDANTPIYLLASGNVLIEGTIDVSGEIGDKFSGGLGGPGGFDGGKPGIGAPPGGGLGPGGGKPGTDTNDPKGAGGGSYATVATTGSSTNQGPIYGTQLLMPLIGGSGGGGMPEWGGGGGGGAILIASSTRIDVNTSGGVYAIRADGAQTGHYGYGSGGAIRLVAPAIAGHGLLSVTGGGWAGDGRIRIDVIDRTGMDLGFNPGNTPGTVVVGGLMAVFPPVSPQLDIVSVGGQQINPGTKTPIFVKLPFGAPASQVIELQARDFNQNVPVTLALIPDSGAPSFYPVTIPNIGFNPSARQPVTVSMPANVNVRVMAWTR